MKSWAVLLAALLIAVAVAFSHRYSLVAYSNSAQHESAWRVDNWTGQILYCDRGMSADVACEYAKIP